jgi:sulfate adenylyltransferase subunit 2
VRRRRPPHFIEPGGLLFFPNPEDYDDEGLVAVGGDLSTERLLLAQLEAESIHIIREVGGRVRAPVMLYSIGKDSAVMVHLALKAFAPRAALPLLPAAAHRHDVEVPRDDRVPRPLRRELGLDLRVHTNAEGLAQGINPFDHGSQKYTTVMKTQALLQALEAGGYDAPSAARAATRRSRARRSASTRSATAHQWDPKNQRPELWNLYNGRDHKGESIRVFPLSNWTELDVWQYIYLENIPIVPLYFAAERPVVERDGSLIMVDDDRMRLRPGETPRDERVRFRTLGCYPLSGRWSRRPPRCRRSSERCCSRARAERQGRLIDFDEDGSMETEEARRVLLMPR